MVAVSGIVVSGALAVSATPAAASDFFAGTTVSLMVSADAGGGYDTYTRLLAPYLRKNIPGNPIVIVQNMPGGGGLRLTQHIYAVADKDGTKIGNVRSSNALDAILGVRGGDIDPTRFEWVGDMSSDVDVCVFWHTSGVRTLDDLRERETIIGATGKGGQNYSFPSAMNYALGTKMKIILGYKGLGDRVLAMERGEVQGNCGINGSTLTSLQADLLKQGKLVPIVQSGGKAHKNLPNVPLTQSFARTDRERRILMTIFSQMDIARTYALPPGTPKDRVAIMRKAFMAAMQDPGLAAEAEKMKLELDPKSGEEVQKIIAEMADLSPELKKEVRAALGE